MPIDHATHLFYNDFGKRMSFNLWFFMNYYTIALYGTYYLTLIFSYMILVSLAGYARAWLTNLMGDYTAKDQGFLTLNPAVHVDLFGLILLLLLGIGWGKQIPVNPNNIQGRFRWLKVTIAMLSGVWVYLFFALVGIIGLSLLISPAGLAANLAAGPSAMTVVGLFISLSIFLAAIELVINSVLLLLMALTHYNEEVISYSFYIILIVPIFIFFVYGTEIQQLLSFSISWLARFIVALFTGK